MAANLKPPSHFFSNVGENYDDRGLIPPSVFEKPKPSDPWKALGEATSEILELKQKNQRLSDARNLTLPVGEEIKARVAVHHTDRPPQTSTHTLETVINHQAEEIVALKKQLTEVETANQRHVNRLENQLMLKDSQHLQELTMLKSEHQALRERYETEKGATDAERERLAREQEAIVVDLKQKLKLLKQEKESEVSKLQTELSLAQSEATERLEELTQKEKSFDLKLEAQKQSLQQMKVYIQQSEQSFKSTEIWRKEIENLTSQLQSVKEDNERLQKESELVSVRLKSQNEIATIQDQELSKFSDSFPEKKKQCLLSLWRNKVYELMVQLKCSELTLKDTDRKWTNKLSNYENALSSSKAQCDVLQHSLQDKQAELEMEKQEVAKLKKNLQQADDVASHLDQSRRETETSLQQLIEFTQNLAGRYTVLETRVKAAGTTLGSYNQRIAFASGRVEMLQSQFARREALIKVRAQEEAAAHGTRPPAEDPVKDTDDEEGGNILQQLLDELERVTMERDQLASQLKADSEMLNDKINTARQQTAGEVAELKTRLADLHADLEEKTRDCETLRESLQLANQTVESSQETVETLRAQLEDASMKAEKDLEDVRREEELKLMEQLAQMEHKVNEARREQTKDIVKVRQMERQMSRDKERAAEHAQKIEQFYKDQCAKLEQKLRGVEKDRNILLNTVRQEGLLGKYQAERGVPRGLDSDDDTSEPAVDPLVYTPSAPRHDGTDPLLYTSSQLGDTQADEPLHEVIDDLKKLAATVLDEEEAVVE